ncbi:permease prefix domain 1-containing protein [Aquibacillus sp. 3ASR75-11]|uniref:Permease prefix domain 1-containing protein n=1 Tax=Terrihalobacillus insolitus TaxID=2950438 RepID=A0A9X3WRF3_9BACI|nr:permease prefix domain 1-containing protein [Terrihalobacillus insolitus]MDC3424502.1 permease prefix domain 1-containing protein [Terrihalobacillus insolitus]
MKKIDKYIDSVYQDFDGTEKEIKELKVEMRSHLLEIVEELKAEGKSESKAVQIALNRFGDEAQLSHGLMEFFEAQKLFAKKLLRFSIGVCIVGIIGLGWLVILNQMEQNERKDLISNIAAQLNEDTEFSTAEEDEVLKQVNYFSDSLKILHLSIYYSEDGMEEAFPAKVENAEYVFHNISPVNNELVPTKGYALNDKWFMQIQFDDNRNNYIALITLGIFIVFGVLIIIWSILNTYIKKYKRRKNDD